GQQGSQQGGQMGMPPGGAQQGQGGGTPSSGQRGGMSGSGGIGGGGGASTELISYLKKNQDGAKWLLAVSSSQSASQLILNSGEPVISMWGWSGSDKAMTLTKLKELVKKGELHYVQLGGGMGGGRGGDSGVSAEVTAWVQEHGTAVQESEYSGGATSNSDSESQSNDSNGSNESALYRLDPSDVS
ncbi:mannosyltransferase YkcB-related protein, partial [Streptomyces phyllanthi]